MFSSRRDAQAHPDRGKVIDPIALDDLVPILEKADGGGDGLALWHGKSWIVADPARSQRSCESGPSAPT